MVIYINILFYTKERAKKMERKKKKGIFCVIIVIITIIAIIILGQRMKMNSINRTKERIINEVTERVSQFGLEDVVVTIDGKDEEYDWYKVFVDCSNIDEFSADEMFALDNSVRGIDDAFVYGFTSNGDRYEIFASTLSIYKNGEEIYDDYYNSESHKNAVNSEIPNSYTGAYDAKLKYSGTDGVLICISEDAMERFMTALSNENEGTIEELLLNGQCAYTEQGTKCNIVDKKLTKCQVKLLDGSYAGETVWVVIEALQEE